MLRQWNGKRLEGWGKRVGVCWEVKKEGRKWGKGINERREQVEDIEVKKKGKGRRKGGNEGRSPLTEGRKEGRD